MKSAHDNDSIVYGRMFSRSNHVMSTIFLFVLSGAIMIGHGARMLFQGIFAPGTSYVPNTFDLIFDWLILVILGCFILWFALSLFSYHSKKKAQTKQ